ncbi:P2Y purinoceptor 2-like [Sminthopsis crassicaudata]|uniref:P2Y purinoceptor 2-like n=1 Tax=Sminthopsis crassicaudata TaxID=9301 RepID=UPI003D682E86
MEADGGPGANASREAGWCLVAEDYKRFYLPVTYSLVLALGLPLNAAVLWLSWCRTRRWSCSTIYLSNLMVADLLYIATLPFLIVNYALGDRWPFGEASCRLVRFLFYANLYGSILLLTCISVHRFLGVCHPVRSLAYRTRRLARRGAGASWALVLLQALPTLAFSETGSRAGRTVCYDLSRPDNFGHFFVYGMLLTLSGFVLPFLIILVCYSLMIRSLLRPAEVRAGTGSSARAKSVRTILAVCGLFALCFGPFHVTRSVYLVVRLRTTSCPLLTGVSVAYKMWRPLVSLNSCLNPVLFFLSGGSNRVRLLRELWPHR